MFRCLLLPQPVLLKISYRLFSADQKYLPRALKWISTCRDLYGPDAFDYRAAVAAFTDTNTPIPIGCHKCQRVFMRRPAVHTYGWVVAVSFDHELSLCALQVMAVPSANIKE